MEDIPFVFSKRPQINIGIINQQLYAFYVVSQDCIMQGCIALFTFEVDVIGVSYFFQDELYVEIYTLVAGKHERGHLFPVVFFKISATLDKNAQIFSVAW